jgi:D-glycero-D-manno-heptose 1,7-bisphosphate phosphatase
MKRRAIFLDRDGILDNSIVRNGKPYPPSSASEVELPRGITDALVQLKNLEFLLIVVTNQPDVVRGTTSMEKVEQINNYLKSKLPLDEIFVCFHDDEDGCICRKPNPGLILDAVVKYNINVITSYMIGDRWKDIEAGRKAGCTTLWVDYGYAEVFKSESPDYTCKSPAEAMQWIIKKELENEKCR